MRSNVASHLAHSQPMMILHTKMSLRLWDSPVTIPMAHMDEDAQCQLHSPHVVLQEWYSKVCTSGTWRSCQGGEAEALIHTVITPPW